MLPFPLSDCGTTALNNFAIQDTRATAYLLIILRNNVVTLKNSGNSSLFPIDTQPKISYNATPKRGGAPKRGIVIRRK